MSAPVPGPSGPPPPPSPGGDPYAPPARRSAGAPGWAKLVSIPAQGVAVLLVVLLAAGLAEQVSRSVVRLAPVAVVPAVGFTLGLLVALALVGLVNRLSAVGSLVVGACWLVLGLVLVFSLDALGLVISASSGLPSGLRGGLLALVTTATLPLVGGLLLAGGLGTALARRSRR